jgi:PhzF family phenazine biosynthesis protein
MNLPIYQVDAFTSELFKGNPAAVCPLEKWLPDEVMQQLAIENNLSETAFIVPEGEGYRIRWFTPGTEVKLCGHATVATAHILFSELNYTKETILFHSLSGELRVKKTAESKIQLDFPANPPEAVAEVPKGMFEGLGIEGEVFKTSFDYLVVLNSQKEVEALSPDFKTLAQVKARGVIASAKGDEVDFVSRCFYPQSGVDEDPVTGSAHTIMIPYWANRLNKNKMVARQLSRRGGELYCELVNDRALMEGYAVTYMKGEYYLRD